jgi:hypothetical protein
MTVATRGAVALIFSAGLAGAALLAALSPASADGPATSGLSLWLESNQGLAADGSSWLDQSGNGHDATALPGQNPTVIPNAINGLPAVQFGGGQALSIAGQVITGQEFTIFAVATDATTSAAGFREIFSNWDTSNQTSSVFLGTTGFPVAVRFTDDIGGANDPIHTQTGVGEISNAGSPFVLTAVSGSTDAFLNLDGSPFYDNGAPLSTRDVSSTGYFLGRQGSSNFEYWNGTIEELLVYNGALTSSEITQTEDYLLSKYGIGSSVPETSTWAMMIAGFAGLGWLGLSRRRAIRSAAA